MTGRPQKFVFDEEFDRRSGASRRQGDLALVQKAEQDGYARGHADGRREADEEAAMRLALAMERVADQAARVLAALDASRAALERDAATLAATFARKLAGTLIDRSPLGPLEEAASDCFRALVGTPHVVVTVPDGQLDAAKTMLDRLALERGYAGRLVVLAEPGLAAGDFRLEWADGGCVRSAEAIDALISAAVARHAGAPGGRNA